MKSFSLVYLVHLVYLWTFKAVSVKKVFSFTFLQYFANLKVNTKECFHLPHFASIILKVYKQSIPHLAKSASAPPSLFARFLDPPLLHVYYFVWKERINKPSKVAAAKSFFTSLCVARTTCFDECFLYFYSM